MIEVANQAKGNHTIRADSKIGSIPNAAPKVRDKYKGAESSGPKKNRTRDCSTSHLQDGEVDPKNKRPHHSFSSLLQVNKELYSIKNPSVDEILLTVDSFYSD